MRNWVFATAILGMISVIEPNNQKELILWLDTNVWGVPAAAEEVEGNIVGERRRREEIWASIKEGSENL